MNKIYYFSKEKLQFVEIKNFKHKLALIVSTAVLLICLILFGGYTLVFSITNSHRNVNVLRHENQILKEKLNEFSALYTRLNNEFDSLLIINNDLRIAANLAPIDEEIRMLGYGGGSSDYSLEFLNTRDVIEIKKADELSEKLARKIAFEKVNYLEISKKLNENKLLYASIPAIKPCEGTVAYHGFGMRLHPILNRVRMHEGIDIVTQTGSKVYAPGKGKVVFVGYKGSYGLTVEIDHGFGYRTLYAHLSKAVVRKGDKVNRKDFIAVTGNTGLSTGPHLHYEVEHNGVKQNPRKFLFDEVSLFN